MRSSRPLESIKEKGKTDAIHWVFLFTFAIIVATAISLDGRFRPLKSLYDYNVCPEKKLTKGILESNGLTRGKIMFALANKDKVLSLSKFR